VFSGWFCFVLSLCLGVDPGSSPYPDDPLERAELYFARGRTLEKKLIEGALALAGRDFENAVDAFPESFEIEELRLARKSYRSAAQAFHEAGAFARQADCLAQIGRIWFSKGDVNRALPELERADQLYAYAGASLPRAWNALLLGRCCKIIDRDGCAEEMSLLANRIFEEEGAYAGSAWVRAIRSYYHDDPERKRQVLRESYETCRTMGRDDIAAEVLYYRCLFNEDVGNNQLALALYEELMQLARDTDNPYLLAKAANNSGILFQDLGELDRAIPLLGMAARLFSSIGNSSVGTTYLNTGQIHAMAGEHKSATALYLLARKVYQGLGSDRMDSTATHSLGLVQKSAGNIERAIQLFAESLEGFIGADSQRGITRTLLELGDCHLIEGEVDEALKYHREALSHARASASDQLEALALAHLGEATLAEGKVDDAICYLEQSLGLRVLSGRVNEEAGNLGSLARAWLEKGDHDRAVELTERALAIYELTGDLTSSLRVVETQSRAHEAAGRFDRAIAVAEQALDLADYLRTRIFSSHLRLTYADAVHDLYQHTVSLLMEAYRRDRDPRTVARAYDTAQRNRARVLLEAVAALERDESGAESPLRLQKLRRLYGRADYRLRQVVEGVDPEELARQTEEIETLIAEWRELEGELDDVLGTDPVFGETLTDIDTIRDRFLDEDTVLVEFSLGEETSQLWVITSDGLRTAQLPGRGIIDERVREVLDLLRARNERIRFETAVERRVRIDAADRHYPRKAFALSRLLLGNTLEGLARKRLVIVPEGSLAYLPFAALPDPLSVRSEWEPLLVDHEIVTIPSVSVLGALTDRAMNKQIAPKTLALFADPVFSEADPRVLEAATEDIPSLAPGNRMRLPRLEETRSEAESIMALVDEHDRFLALGFDASAEVASGGLLEDYRIVHFATHGIVDATKPELSGLVFSLIDEHGKESKGFLGQARIFEMKLQADLVVLSACQTALGASFRGEGMVGLTHGFFNAGADRVLASLWKIEDQATSELMSRFYRALLEQGLTPSSALRQAQLSMRRDTCSAPYYWGAFVIMGPWQTSP